MIRHDIDGADLQAFGRRAGGCRRTRVRFEKARKRSERVLTVVPNTCDARRKRRREGWGNSVSDSPLRTSKRFHTHRLYLRSGEKGQLMYGIRERVLTTEKDENAPSIMIWFESYRLIWFATATVQAAGGQASWFM